MRGQQISPRQIEQIKQTYAETDSLTAAAKAAAVGKATASKYIHSWDEFEQVRTEKRTAMIGDVAAAFAAVVQLYLDRLMDPAVIARTNARDAIIVVATAIDKVLLLTGQATARTEQVTADDARARLAAKIDEIVARRQAISEHPNGR